MTEAVSLIITEARKLSLDERLEVLAGIIAILDEAQPTDLDAAILVEAKDRLAAFRRGELKARDLDEALAKYAL